MTAPMPLPVRRRGGVASVEPCGPRQPPCSPRSRRTPSSTRRARHPCTVPVIAEQHLALMVGPVRVAAAGSVAAHDIMRAFRPLASELDPIVTQWLSWSRVWSEGAAAGLGESRRRARENPRPDLSAPDVPEVLAELVAALAETYAALRVAREEIRRSGLRARRARPRPLRRARRAGGRLGDHRDRGAKARRGARPSIRVPWGPNPADPRVGAPVALALSTSLALSAALGAMATIDDHRLTGQHERLLQPVFEIAAQALWSATDLAAGVAICLRHPLDDGHRWPDDPLDAQGRCLQSATGYRDALALQLDGLDRYQPADASAARPGYVLILGRVEEHLEALRSAIGGCD